MKLTYTYFVVHMTLLLVLRETLAVQVKSDYWFSVVRLLKQNVYIVELCTSLNIPRRDRLVYV